MNGVTAKPAIPTAPTCSPDFLAVLAAMIRDVYALAACTCLDRATDPRRVLPTLPPAQLWRSWPRVLERAAQLAAAMPVAPINDRAQEFLFQLADTIEAGGKAPVLPDAAGVARE